MITNSIFKRNLFVRNITMNKMNIPYCLYSENTNHSAIASLYHTIQGIPLPAPTLAQTVLMLHTRESQLCLISPSLLLLGTFHSLDLPKGKISLLAGYFYPPRTRFSWRKKLLLFSLIEKEKKLMCQDVQVSLRHWEPHDQGNIDDVCVWCDCLYR